MEEILFEILAAIIGALSDAFLEFAIEVLFAILAHAMQEVFENPSLRGPARAVFGYLAFGVIAGGLSLLPFPHALVHPSRFHGISLLMSPLITGSAMALIGYILRRQGKQSAQIESFAYGFTFALGMAAIRLIFTK